jgi:hypothetical protein
MDERVMADEVIEATAPPRESRRAMQRRFKRPPGRPRNPKLEQRFAPTQEQRDLVRLLAGYGDHARSYLQGDQKPGHAQADRG